jgi:hypothetical protein
LANQFRQGRHAIPSFNSSAYGPTQFIYLVVIFGTIGARNNRTNND